MAFNVSTKDNNDYFASYKRFTRSPTQPCNKSTKKKEKKQKEKKKRRKTKRFKSLCANSHLHVHYTCFLKTV